MKENKSNKTLTYVSQAAVVVFIVLLILKLIWPNVLGMADNHDFWRLMKPFGIVYPPGNEGNTFQFVQLDFHKTQQYFLEPLSSSLLFVAIGYGLSTLFQSTMFSLLWLGIVHIFCYTVAFCLFFRALLNKNVIHAILLFVLALYVLTDSVFTVYFNSFYQESAVIIFFLTFVGVFLYSQKSFWLEAFILLLLVLTKVPSTVFVILFIPLLFKYRTGQKMVLKSLIVFVVLLSAIAYNLLAEQEASSPNTFNSFFRGLVAEENAAQVFRDFHLADLGYGSFVNKDFWSVSLSDAQTQDFYSKVDRQKIISYYLRHPTVLVRRLYLAASLLLDSVRPDNLGNRTQQFSLLMIVERPSIWAWSNLLRFIILPAFFFSLWQLWYLWHERLKSLSALLIMSLTVLLPLLVAVVVIGDGTHEFAKHNVPFYFVFSLWFLLSCDFWYKQLVLSKRV